jgi:hypothetical protein
MGDAPEDPVLELRVHGLNNTTPAALLDLRPDEVTFVMGDKFGSFWRPKRKATAKLMSGQQGYVPPGIRREAYSWGGMVRAMPDFAGSSTGGGFASVLARIGYALLLPFALGNVVQWMRRLPPAPTPAEDAPDADATEADTAPLTERGGRTTAGLTRLFGLLLTLLLTSTAATLSLDLGAAQCAAAATLCGPAQGFFAMFAGWTAGQRLALFALGPVIAAGGLWLLSTLSRLRYDVLPGMGGHRAAHEDSVRDPAEAPAPAQPTALLTSPCFWSNRVTRHLAHAHFAGAIFFTTILTAAQAAFSWHTSCTGLGGFAQCIGQAWGRTDFDTAIGFATLGCVGLLVVLVVVFLLPTTVPDTEERIPQGAVLWADGLVVVAVLVFLGLEIVLLFVTGPRTPGRLYGAGAAPLVIVTAAGLIALSGIFWRPRTGRRATLWLGCGPAGLMSFALAVATAMSAIVTTTVGDWLNGPLPASALARGVVRPGAAPTTVYISSSYIALGFGVLAGAAVLAIVAGAMLLRPRNVDSRAKAWKAPTSVADIPVSQNGVLPPSPRTLLASIQGRRTIAAQVNLAEPLGAAAALALGVGVAGGAVSSWVAYAHPGAPLWDPARTGGWWPTILQPLLDVAMLALAWLGVTVLALLVAGASRGAVRPIAVVWDIICYLPRTGHPFGPPAYAERAVPEIAGRLFEWLDAGDETDPDRIRSIADRRAVLVGHSMGAVLAVSALALLASSPQTRPVLQRISLLTVGVQLRAFFGRMFPELHGPDVLGIEPSRAPRAFGADSDPWAVDFAQSGLVDHADGKLSGTLLAGYGVPWRSLWRLTDILGFVVGGPHPNSVDVLADELDLTGYMVGVDGHRVYYRAPQFQAELLALAELPPE